MEKAGMIKEVSKCEKSEGPIFYLPHRPVVREDSTTTKVRPVFDASAKGYNGISLNDCLETGPNLLPNLLGLLTRFRRWKVAVSADVAKAFLQIRVHEANQNVLRFLWELGGQVLGLKWIPAEDYFSFSALAVAADVAISKRTVLSFIARLFDPLGFLAPFIISAKLIFQQLWELEIDWDDELPNPLKGQFENWLKELGSLQEWKIPRSFATSSWSDADEIQLHIFYDASEKAYGCCAYPRVVEGTRVSVNLILTKARVAPLKTVTLPRLELLGALLGSRVLKFLISELHLSCDTVYKCYTDSMVALVHNKVISGFQALRQAGAPEAALEPVTEGSLKILGRTH
ncbi:gamma-tubulin complex component 4 [Plakobranchus ocellatus]|uniref:Gamma-tubulin complex component 4 n=1 Tax=Plakobranchus ocellatus TaxID=259542 RepID=A0AAV4APV7_9GAST|nr:gamma-tubulin complex component 4 [Plakobranchus ocellatus]